MANIPLENKRINSYTYTANGHRMACILRYDENTCLLPINRTEAHRLYNALKQVHNALNLSNDFPEQNEYLDTLNNLRTIEGMLSLPITVKE
jgi:hypothetical protein